LFLENWFFKKKIKFFYIYLSLDKLANRKYFSVNEKHFSIKEKYSLVFRKIFSFYFKRKTFFESYEKFRNIILFADYIKFGPQIYDCYVYILF